MDIAIVTVNYNSSKKTLRAINSLSLAGIISKDIYVVDNASRVDDEAFLSKNLPKGINYFSSKINLGFAGGNNIAINKILKKQYKAIFLMNPDAIINDKSFFDILYSEMNSEKAGIVGPLIKYLNNKKKIHFAGGFFNKFNGLTIIRGKNQLDNGQYKENIECDFVSGSAMLISRNVFEKIGLLPEEYFLFFEEADFCLKAKKNNFKIIFSPKTYLYHEVSGSIKYMSNVYIYYMARNYKIFAKKYVDKKQVYVFWLYYLFVYIPGYIFLSFKAKNFVGWVYVLKGMLGASF